MGRSDGTSELESHGDGDADTCACRVRYGRVARSRGVRERKKPVGCEVRVWSWTEDGDRSVGFDTSIVFFDLMENLRQQVTVLYYQL